MTQQLLMSTLPIFVVLAITLMRYFKVRWANSRSALVVQFAMFGVYFVYFFMHVHFALTVRPIAQWKSLDYMMVFILPAAVFGILWYRQRKSLAVGLGIFMVLMGTAIATFIRPHH